MKRYIFVFSMVGILYGCSEDEIIDIESENEYDWQKYMNENEYNKLMNGMTYLEVIKIVGGQGEEIVPGLYEWPDEQLLTQAYELKFDEDKLIDKKIIEKRGNSAR